MDDASKVLLVLGAYVNSRALTLIVISDGHLCDTVCNGPSKCIFVRVVDTWFVVFSLLVSEYRLTFYHSAGCKKGSKHVDLTKAAFTKLAPLDQGLLNVNMRLSTAPKTWYVSLSCPHGRHWLTLLV